MIVCRAFHPDFSVQQWKSKLSCDREHCCFLPTPPTWTKPSAPAFALLPHHLHTHLLYHWSVKRAQDASKPSSSSTLSSSHMLFAIHRSKAQKQAGRSPWLIALCPTGSWHLYSWQTMRCWLWWGDQALLRELYGNYIYARIIQAHFITSGAPLILLQLNTEAFRLGWNVKYLIFFYFLFFKNPLTFTKWIISRDVLATLHSSLPFWSSAPINFKLWNFIW